MSVQSIGNTLTAQELMKLLGQQPLTSADPNAANANGVQTDDSTGQNLPTGTNTADATDTVSGSSNVSSPTPLDSATIQALLKIQESQSMASTESQFFGDDMTGVSTGDPLLDAMDGTTNSPYGVSSANSMQEVLEELDPSATSTSSSSTDPLLADLEGSGSTNSMQTVLDQLDPSAYSNSGGTSSLQSILAEIDPAAALGGSGGTADPTALQQAMDTMSGSATSTNNLSSTNQAMLDLLDAMGTQTTGTTANDLGATQLAVGTNAATQVE